MDYIVCAVADLMGVQTCGDCASTRCEIQRQVEDLQNEIKKNKEEISNMERELSDLEKQIEELNKEN